MEEEKELDTEVAPEVEAARKSVHIRLVTTSLKEALSHGMAGGELGEMVTSCIVTHDLDLAITTAERIGVEVCCVLFILCLIRDERLTWRYTG